MDLKLIGNITFCHSTIGEGSILPSGQQYHVQPPFGLGGDIVVDSTPKGIYL